MNCAIAKFNEIPQCKLGLSCLDTWFYILLRCHRLNFLGFPENCRANFNEDTLSGRYGKNKITYYFDLNQADAEKNFSSLCSYCKPGCSETRYTTVISQTQLLNSEEDWENLNKKYFSAKSTGMHKDNTDFYRYAKLFSYRLIRIDIGIIQIDIPNLLFL